MALLRAALSERLYEQVLRSVFRNLSDMGTGVILLLVASAMRALPCMRCCFLLVWYCHCYGSVRRSCANT